MKRLKQIWKESVLFYPEYLLAHSDRGNRFLHFVGATAFFVMIALFFITGNWWWIPLAIFTGYLLPGIGHHFLQHNNSFRTTKPVLCVICATRLYVDTISFRVGRRMKAIAG
jgi:hypothetical protein